MTTWPETSRHPHPRPPVSSTAGNSAADGLVSPARVDVPAVMAAATWTGAQRSAASTERVTALAG
ncbi:MAG: hypothetical protein ACRCXL_14630 [Dermatophilaceae bacterium]